jgi:MFS family permease
LRDSLHLTREQIGSLNALFFIGAVLTGIPVGWLADWFGVRRFLIVGQLMGGLPLVALPFLHTYHGLLLGMPLAGVAHGSVMVLTTKALYDWFPRERRATVIGAKFCALGLSTTIAVVAGPMLALWFGLRQVFAGVGGLLVVSAGCALLYRDRPQDGSRAVPRPAAAGRCSVWRNLNFWRLTTVGFLFAGAQFSFNAYLTIFLHEHWGFPLGLSGSLLGLAQGVSTASRVPCGWISDRWLKGERRALLRGMGVVAMSALLALLLVPPGSPSFVLAAIILLYGMSGLSWLGTYQTLATELAGRAFAGVGAGIAATFVHVGSTVMPPVFGYLADVTGAFTVSWGVLVLWLLLGIGLLGWVRTAPVPLEGIEELATPRLLPETP